MTVTGQEITDYVDRVRAALADLPPAVRDELTEDLPEHLAEVAAEGEARSWTGWAPRGVRGRAARRRRRGGRRPARFHRLAEARSGRPRRPVCSTVSSARCSGTRR
ncbi:hypothetical protein V2I01_19575 [Micromonospora sp. BRA006-A]|nr:hypothetical protein [Micromonospora sp. BRA006-A]